MSDWAERVRRRKMPGVVIPHTGPAREVIKAVTGVFVGKIVNDVVEESLATGLSPEDIIKRQGHLKYTTEGCAGTVPANPWKHLDSEFAAATRAIEDLRKALPDPNEPPPELLGPPVPIIPARPTARPKPPPAIHPEDDPEVQARALEHLEARIAAAQAGREFDGEVILDPDPQPTQRDWRDLVNQSISVHNYRTLPNLVPGRVYKASWFSPGGIVPGRSDNSLAMEVVGFWHSTDRAELIRGLGLLVACHNNQPCYIRSLAHSWDEVFNAMHTLGWHPLP